MTFDKIIKGGGIPIGTMNVVISGTGGTSIVSRPFEYYLDLIRNGEELRLEIKDNAERIDKLCNLLKRNNEKLRTLKEMTNQTPCNYRTPPKYNVEYLDDKMVIVNGIQYQRVEEQKPQTLFDALLDDFDWEERETICRIVRGWLIDHTVIETEDAEKVTFTVLKEQLQTPK